jgi:hypothetical protein
VGPHRIDSIRRHRLAQKADRRIEDMFKDFETTVTVGIGGRVELIVPDAPIGAKVRIAVRDDDDWASRLASGTLRAPSLPDHAIRRDAVYTDNAP